MQDATCALIDSSLFVRIRSFPTSPHSNAVSFALCVAVAFTDRGLSPPLRFVRFHVSPSSSIPLGITLTTHYLRSYMSVTAHHTKRHRLMSVSALKDQGLQRLQGSYPWLIRSSLFPEYVILFFSLMSLTLGHVGRWNLPVFVLTM